MNFHKHQENAYVIKQPWYEMHRKCEALVAVWWQQRVQLQRRIQQITIVEQAANN